MGSRSERRLPRRSVDGDDAALPVQAPQRAPQRATGRRGRTGREQHLRTWPSTRYAGRTGGSTRVRRCGESTATPSALRRAVQGKTCGVWYRSYETLVPNRHPLGVGGDPRSLCRSGVTRMSLMGFASHGRRSDYATTRNAFRHPSAPRTPPPLRDGSCAVACDGDGDARSSSHTTEPTCKRASMYDCRIDRTAPHG